MGRPKSPKRKISVSVTLEEKTKKEYRKIGNGNLSAGIELALKQLMECQTDQQKYREIVSKLAEKSLAENI